MTTPPQPPTDSPPPTSATFLDAAGHEWLLRLDYAILRKIRDVAQVDLGDVAALSHTWARLLYEDETAMAVIHAAVQPRVPGGTSLADFEAAMNGDALDAARDALKVAIESFTGPRKRGMATKAIEGVTAGYKAATALAETRIETTLATKTEEGLARLGTTPPEQPESSATSTTAGS